MGAAEKKQTLNGKKVSKPIMEKKRRDRINECLQQLKHLLESSYTNNIRKRKLEKADILELTVKHLRDLQNSQQGSTGNNGKCTEYQAGFRNCLNGVSKYLLTSDNSSRSVRLLNHLTNNVPDACGIPRSFSTLDSGAAQHVTAPRSASNFLQQQHSKPAANPFATFCKPHTVELPCTSDKAISSTSVSNETIFVAQNPKQREQAGNFPRVSGQSKQNNATYNVCSAPLNFWRPW
ncbi:Transcription factor HES-1-A [Acipenser ruthenus]|uniref:Transcription factor HES-1-A n=1 Tax=Acipenser ruthenus TaxID=7906 RepID=A0A444UXQ4_ACIRT|nr:Transcription factor HES-1-A [Acipenser ruthenus]